MDNIPKPKDIAIEDSLSEYPFIEIWDSIVENYIDWHILDKHKEKDLTSKYCIKKINSRMEKFLEHVESELNQVGVYIVKQMNISKENLNKKYIYNNIWKDYDPNVSTEDLVYEYIKWNNKYFLISGIPH